jgi:nicotinate-nucleotide adenylyltransferase
MSGARAHARIGIFGGTFNPIHFGHLRAAEEVAEALDLERVLFVPSARPPHKRGDEAIAPAEARLAWVRLALGDNPRFAVDPLEIERAGPSYLIETLRMLGERHGRERLVFILGRDAFAELATWREPRALLSLVDYAVMSRPPVREGSLAEWLPAALAADLALAPDGRSAAHRQSGTRIQLVEITALDISASEIRARLREGRSVRYLLPDAVREAVVKSGAYGGSGDPGSERAPGAEWRR